MGKRQECEGLEQPRPPKSCSLWVLCPRLLVHTTANMPAAPEHFPQLSLTADSGRRHEGPSTFGGL